MGESQLPAGKPELYERLIDRLGLALDTARTSMRLRDEAPAELELRGLSRAEFEVIKTYLDTFQKRADEAANLRPQAEPASARIIWLKDIKRTVRTPRPRKASRR
ncbi:hypothetical protein IRZ81_01970 [Pseudomonas putida]|uniref:Uncharacterized protein n=1 Tax=Pseudomonas parafulva TaxID=157782 RepID=A0ABM6IYQ2_9PSED|nr:MULTISPECIES: hypothetical protein [Pseudomonas]AQW67226.1 hypothetical protein B2J77_02765 [Pseudomonas parafulva]AUA31584.1 hypothetical protein CWR53_02700 [Pseudomonas sp. SGAir0191]MBF8649552.1 hypothetical protein [Pseudomonas putida]MBF8653477.1 hypothetical protein [Pseudomonas putida]MBF8660052.1 hypothetical protein [Pseudomonas putida]